MSREEEMLVEVVGKGDNGDEEIGAGRGARRVG